MWKKFLFQKLNRFVESEPKIVEAELKLQQSQTGNNNKKVETELKHRMQTKP